MKRCSIFMVILILGMIGSGCTNRESEANKKMKEREKEA